MISDAQGDTVAIGQNQTGATLLRRASDATPVVLAVPPVQVAVNNKQRSFTLALNVLEAPFKKNHKKAFIRTCYTLHSSANVKFLKSHANNLSWVLFNTVGNLHV